MAYRLEPGEDVSAGTRRMALELIDRATSHLTDREGDCHRNVHEARKRFKEMRAVLRLVRPELDSYFPFENVFYRDSGRLLSAARDAKAIIEAVEKMEKRFEGEGATALLAAVRRVLEDRLERNTGPGPVGEVVSRLGEARDRVQIWPLQKKSFGALRSGLRMTYAQGRKAFQRSYDEPTPENFHEWRKRVKDHWYHSQILQGLWPDLMKGYIATMKELSQLLGDDHDLVVVREALLAEPETFGGDEAVFAMLQLIDRRRSELEDAARAIGAKVYAEKPSEWISRMESMWDAARAASAGI